VQFLGVQPLFEAYGKEVKAAMIFKGIKYRGNLPTDPELY
jgi:hypothetical protein